MLKVDKKLNEKFLVFSADDFGLSEANNNAIKRAYNDGFLTSTCVMANGHGFEHAVKEILPQCEGMGIGAHLNIFEGKALSKIAKTSKLCDGNGNFRHGFISYLLNSCDKQLLNEIEEEFRLQIESILEHTPIDHINTHVHIHAVPAVFEITCALAKEYDIPFVRTQYEKFYTIPDFSKHTNFWYPINTAKIGILNTCTFVNNQNIYKYNLKTNNYQIGIGYTGYMDSKTIEYGLKAINKPCIAEIIVHPAIYDGNKNTYQNARETEFRSTIDKELFEKITQMGWILTNFKKLSN